MSNSGLERRTFLQGTAVAVAGLMIPFHVPELRGAPAPAAPAAPPVNAFLRIGTDDSVTVVLAHSEMGQGIWTALAMMIAEELACDWSKVRCEHAPAAPVYISPGSTLQITGGSGSTTSEFDRYRTVGAQARDMLIRAAAARWKVAPRACRAANGVVTAGTRKLSYGQLAEDAMKLAPPAKVTLKSPKDWKLIGTAVKRLDTPEKITGQAKFGIDVAFPGLRTAVVARAPAFGAKLVKFDAAAALKVPGVEQVVAVESGVAVVAAHFWAAKRGRDALVVEWSKPEGGGIDTAKQLAGHRALAKRPGEKFAEHGAIDAALTGAKTRVVAEYDVPYLAHAAMEPVNCAAKVDGDRVEIWTGTQCQTLDQRRVAKLVGTTEEKVAIHTMFLGGAFGRRVTPTSDFVVEAVRVAMAARVPVKVVWTREDDMRGGWYRPAFVHRVEAGLDTAGKLVAWDHVVAGQPIFRPKNGLDESSVAGIAESPYLAGAAARRVTLHSTPSPITVLWWRSVGASHVPFAIESMIDELAHAAKQDPLAFRLAHLAHNPRQHAALKLAAEKAGWGTPPAPGRARGLAIHESFDSIIAEVAEVSIENGAIRVHAVTCAVDCGTAVNPLSVEAQVQGSIAFGLSAALHGKLTLVDGAVQQGNFHDYPVLRMSEMPAVAVHLIPSGAKMGGIGEPATAPIAPAVANAVFALTKQRLRSLPLRLA